MSYTIADIKSKIDYVNPTHKGILHCECLIDDVEIGRRSTLLVKPSYDPDCWHTIWLSRLQNVEPIVYDDVVWGYTLETENSIYTLYDI